LKNSSKTKFEFLTGEIPPTLQFSGEHNLYNVHEYINTWPDINTLSFYILHRLKNKIIGYIRFQVIGKKALSPYMAPFGSFTIADEVNFVTLYEFNNFIVDYLKDIGIREIEIKHYPRFYNTNATELIVIIFGLNGFNVTTIDINQYIKVSDSPFSSNIHSMERRRLNKCEKAGFIFNEHQNTEAERMFKYIESFRKIRKIPVNIDLDTMINLVGKFPDKYKFFSVSIDQEIIALTIVVKVNNSVLYNFLPAHNELYNHYSPMIFLLNGIYKYAVLNDYQFIDLGISSKDGKPQQGLIEFKERLGGITTSKLTFTKEI
jgi:hypothetical protein